MTHGNEEVQVMELDSLQVTLDIPGMGKTKIAWAPSMDGGKVLMLTGVNDQAKLFAILERLSGRPVPVLRLVPPEPAAPDAQIIDFTQPIQAGRVVPLPVPVPPAPPEEERTERPTVILSTTEPPV